jgi:8-oxo-dGTP pyrophosphatase MutT (NUDIX family)
MESARQATSDFDLNPDVVLSADRTLKQAAVLIAVTDDGQIILTKRSAQLKHHPGQIAFAGGRKDDTDRDLVHTATREAREEIGLPEASVDVLGLLPPHETVTNFAVTPVLAVVPAGQVYVPEPGEVDEVFRVPVDHVLTRGNFFIERRRWRGRWRHYYTVPYGPYYIWGATARILRGLAEGWDK